jgi:hypothetical protein
MVPILSSLRPLLAGLVLLLVQPWPGAAAAEDGRPQMLAVFPVELADTSGEAPKPGRAEQIAATTGHLASLLEGSGRYRAADLGPLRDRLAGAGPLYRDDRWVAMAREVGAEAAALTVVHKMSTLISSMHVWLVEVATGRVLRAGAVSLRGDTEEAWRRAADYLVRNVLLSEAPGRPSLASPFPGG